MSPNWVAGVLDVEGAFPQGKILNHEVAHICIPEGLENDFPSDIVLRLNVPICGTKQAAKCFCEELVKKTQEMEHGHSKADPMPLLCVE